MPLGRYLASTEKRVRDRAIRSLAAFVLMRAQEGGLSMSPAELSKLWKGLFYCFWMSDKPLVQQQLPGPAGLVRSQVMRSSDDAIRMPLNVAPEDAEQSASMGAVYPEHVAFACRDIEGVARRAAQRGLDRLPVPANYYADLQARARHNQEVDDAERAADRKSQVGSGDRSERIRTYNFPQGRVTDHRINLTLYSLNEVISGAVEQVIEPLLQEYQADQLAALGD